MTQYSTKAKGLKPIISEDEYKALTPGKRMLYDIYYPPRPVALPSRPAGSGYIHHPVPVSHNSSTTIIVEEDNSLRDLMFGVAVAEIIDDSVQQSVYVEPQPEPVVFGGGDFGGGGSSGGWDNSQQQPDEVRQPTQPEYVPEPEPAYTPDPEPEYNTPDPEPDNSYDDSSSSDTSSNDDN